MKKILVIQPELEKELFISQGFAKAFRALGIAVLEKPFKSINTEELKDTKFDFVFNCEKNIIPFLTKDFADSIQTETYVHFLEDISGLKDCELFKIKNNFIFSSDKSLTKERSTRFLTPAIDAPSYKTRFQEYRYPITFAGKVNSLQRLKVLTKIIENFGEISIFADIDDFNESVKLIEKENLLSGFLLSLYKNSYRGYKRTQEELGRLYSQTKINLDLGKENADKLNYRVFEVLASGGFLLAEDNNYIKTYFDDGRELETFKTTEEAIDKIRFYLQNLNLAQSIAMNGKRRVSTSYTFKDRAKEILTTLKEKRREHNL
ncbi:glycosyltransferase family 1 protein [bacterium]|nr:glycosyltransferase family 1 protein [bacterium]